MEDHGRFDYSPIIDRAPVALPDGARIAVWVIPNIEHFHFDKPGISTVPLTAEFEPDVLNHSWRDYGNRVGIWRIMETMQKHGVPGTVALNAEVCRHETRIIEEGNKLGWEWMGHGMTNTVMHTGVAEGEERGMIAEVVGTIAEHTGAAPKGWLGPALTETHNTLDLLAEAGIEYVADWVNDEQPYPMKVRQGAMWSIPYSIEINDISSFMFQGRSPAEFGQMIKDQFDVLYAEGERHARVMSICIHPFVVGHPFRCKYFDEALAHIKGHDGVWWAKGHEIVEWWRGQTG
jgi:peptidoglycan/xylan/chitin deacetylase (PgdA/CDA1 family)